jgi:hypothetical protein
MSRFAKLKEAAATMRPTVYVRHKDGGHCAYIAEDDFSEELHELVEAPPDAPAEAPAEAPEDDGGAGDDAGDAGGDAPAFDVDGYDGLNAGEVIQLINGLEDAAVVAAVAAHEETTKKRKTVLHAAAARTEELEGTEDGAD